MTTERFKVRSVGPRLTTAEIKVGWDREDFHLFFPAVSPDECLLCADGCHQPVSLGGVLLFHWS